MNFEARCRQSIRDAWHLAFRAVIASLAVFTAGLLRADDLLPDPIPAAAARRAPIWVSPISPYDSGENTSAAHAVQIDAAPGAGYVQTSAFAQASTDSSPTEEQLPPGGYLWGGSPSQPGPAGSLPSSGFSVVGSGSAPPAEAVNPPATGNLWNGLGLGPTAPLGVPIWGPLGDRPITLMPALPPEAIRTVLRVHQSITDEVGDDGPVTSIGGFFPHSTEHGLWFFDGQFNILEDANNPGEQTFNFGSNLGLGARWIVPSLNSVAGLSSWYDLDRTRPDFVHQVGVSGEWLGDVWQARLNGYFPAGTNRISTFSGVGPAQTRYDSLDMGGMDFELGRRLPGWLGDNGVSLYFGGYYYRADASFDTFGAATRLEAIISPNLSIDVKFSNDHLFKNRVGVDITWFLPSSKCKSCTDTYCSELYRLTEPVERNRTVVYATQAINPP